MALLIVYIIRISSSPNGRPGNADAFLLMTNQSETNLAMRDQRIEEKWGILKDSPPPLRSWFRGAAAAYLCEMMRYSHAPSQRVGCSGPETSAA